MSSHKILICGGGIAGATLAYWLAKRDFEVLVVERSSAKYTAGQGIDIEGPALEIVKLMGVLDKIKEKTTREAGFAIVDEQDCPYGVFDVDGGVSLTRSIEIMRGDLAEILSEAANKSDNVTFQFDTTIRSIRQSEKQVVIDLEDKKNGATQTKEFDLVVGADGIRSRTRQLAMGTDKELNCLKDVGAFCAFFSVPKEDQDWPRSRFCQFPERRSICIRPQGENSKISSAYVGHMCADNASLIKAHESGNISMQKEAMAELYSGLGWETPRLIPQMMKTDNFYFEHLAQVKLDKWSKDRVVLVGDAAWAPTPLTGQGTALAILGAYVLAQELSRSNSPEDQPPTTAFERYEKRLRAYVEAAQNIPLGGYLPFLLHPQTSWGIWIFRQIAAFATWTRLAKILPDPKAAEFDLQAE